MSPQTGTGMFIGSRIVKLTPWQLWPWTVARAHSGVDKSLTFDLTVYVHGSMVVDAARHLAHVAGYSKLVSIWSGETGSLFERRVYSWRLERLRWMQSSLEQSWQQLPYVNSQQIIGIVRHFCSDESGNPCLEHVLINVLFAQKDTFGRNVKPNKQNFNSPF